jgi:hypothetical protein
MTPFRFPTSLFGHQKKKKAAAAHGFAYLYMMGIVWIEKKPLASSSTLLLFPDCDWQQISPLSFYSVFLLSDSCYSKTTTKKSGGGEPEHGRVRALPNRKPPFFFVSMLQALSSTHPPLID